MVDFLDFFDCQLNFLPNSQFPLWFSNFLFLVQNLQSFELLKSTVNNKMNR